jgi:hypothetical protein
MIFKSTTFNNFIFCIYALVFVFNVNNFTVELQYLITLLISIVGIFCFYYPRKEIYITNIYILIITLFAFKFFYGSFKFSVFISVFSFYPIILSLRHVFSFAKISKISTFLGKYLIFLMVLCFFPFFNLDNLEFTRLISTFTYHVLFSDDFRSTDMMPYLSISFFSIFFYLKVQLDLRYVFFIFLILLFPVLKFDKTNLWLIYISLFSLSITPIRYFKIINIMILVVLLLIPFLIIHFSIIYSNDPIANLLTSGRIEIWSSVSTELLKNYPFNILLGVGHDFVPYMVTPFSDSLTFDDVSYHSGLFRFMAQDGYLLYSFSCFLLYFAIKELGNYSTFIFILVVLYNIFDGSFFTNFSFYPILIFPYLISKNYIINFVNPLNS